MAKQRGGTASKKQRLEAMQKAKRSKQIRFTMIGGVALALIAFALSSVLRTKNQAFESVQNPGSVAEGATNRDGSAEAPIQIVEFGDFNCPACRQWHNSGYKDVLKSQYGDDVAITFRHFAWSAPKAAAASQCAADQGQFWAFHDYLYGTAPQGQLSDGDLKGYASQLGLDRGAFDSCLDGNDYGKFVQNEYRDAQALGLRGTPAFFVNGEQFHGGPSDLITLVENTLNN